MKRVLVDTKNTIVYEGSDAKNVLKVLIKPVSQVTEEDEVNYEKQLRTLSWEGKLRYEVHFDLKFEGIDDWNRPVFKDVDSGIRFGSVEKLYGYSEFKETGLQYFKDNPQMLEYFGQSFNCEPHGGRQDFLKFNFIDKEIK